MSAEVQREQGNRASGLATQHVEVADTSDCDDTDPDVYPGSTEIEGNGEDDDCDGRVDEIRVCQDGTGDFDTIQAAVDAAPVDGASVEVCPGTYYEAVAIGDRVIEIYGETGDPEDVVIDATDLERAIFATANDSTTSYAIRGLTVIGGLQGAITVFGGSRLSISHLVVRDTHATDIYMVMLYATAIHVEDCEMYNNSAPLAYFLLIDGNDDSYVRRCYLHGNDAAVLIYGPGTEISNNLVVGNEAVYNLIQQTDIGPSSASMLYNNTVVDNLVGSGPVVQVSVYDAWWPTYHNFRNNIFSGNTADNVIMYDTAGWGTCGTCDQNADGTCSTSEALANCTAPVLEYNWFGESLADQCTSPWCASMLTSGNQYAVDLGLSMTSDPPYALPAGSPAIDGGDPSAEYMDGDGSINDPGRYGGPAGAW